MEPDQAADETSAEERKVTVLRRTGASEVEVGWIPAFVRRVMTLAGAEEHEVTIVLTGDQEVRDLNRRYRGKDAVTDILSFPAGGVHAEGILGDIVIAAGRASRQAAQRHHAMAIELRYLLVHGVLHLLGFDHETDDGEMDREERRIRGLLGDDLDTAGQRIDKVNP